MHILGERPTVHVTLRLPAEIVEAYKGMTDAKNPWRAIMRDVLKQYLRKLGKVS